MSRDSPRRVRPKFPPEWHVPNLPSQWITWEHAKGKLSREEVYWVSTTRVDGRPHAVPVWGIWDDDTFFFETDSRSVKAKNIARNHNTVVHIQDGFDTVIVEGKATMESRPELLRILQSRYKAKYGYAPDWSEAGSQVVYRVEPKLVYAWKNPHMHRSMVKFVF